MSISKVPKPLDFLAVWGLEPRSEEVDRLYWAYDLEIPGGGNLIVEFCGVERWVGTTVQVGGATSSMSFDHLVELRFVDLGGPLQSLVGRFDSQGRGMHLEISNSETVSVQWRPVWLGE